MKKYNETIQQFGKYILVGIINTLLSISLIMLFINIIGINYIIADIIGYIFGITCSFLLNKYFTFKRSKFHFIEITKFIIVFVVSFSFQLGFVFLVSEIIKLDKNIAMCAGMAIYALINFTLNKVITFR